MTTVTVRPVAGRLIFMPDQNFAKLTEPTTVVQDAFYSRAIQQGDIEIVPDVKTAAPQIADAVIDTSAPTAASAASSKK